MATKTKKTPADPHLAGYNEDSLEGLGVAVPFEEPDEPDDPAPVAVRKAVETQLAAERVERAAARRKSATDVAAEDGLAAATDPSVAAAIAQLRTELQRTQRELAAVKKSAEGGDEGEGGYPFMYYKRPKDGGPMAGWIVCANGGVGPRSGVRDVGTYSTLLGKGFKPLPRYGITGPPASTPRPGQEYEVFLNSGGAKEVPASQVLALRWHMEPPVPGTVFPQYEKIKDDVIHFLCDEGGCELEFWFLPGDSITAAACLGHLRRSHEYKWAEARAMLEDQGVPVKRGQVLEEHHRKVQELRDELEADDEDED